MVGKFVLLLSIQSGAAYHSLGFEDQNLGSSPSCWAATVATYCPSKPGGTTQILIFKTLRVIGSPALNNLFNAEMNLILCYIFGEHPGGTPFLKGVYSIRVIEKGTHSFTLALRLNAMSVYDSMPPNKCPGRTRTAEIPFRFRRLNSDWVHKSE